MNKISNLAIQLTDIIPLIYTKDQFYDPHYDVHSFVLFKFQKESLNETSKRCENPFIVLNSKGGIKNLIHKGGHKTCRWPCKDDTLNVCMHRREAKDCAFTERLASGSSLKDNDF
mmetsp:Transcript_19422/g.23921  ORF Transcript_19422/g.23921 Transcript_19422/m.23921 type:complete len:115 (+) Transcript_19422:659-1003(+)